jgi:ribosomal-protein-serine acetyltransferase
MQTATLFSLNLGSGFALALRDDSTVEPLHALIIKNLERLRRWEPWAHGDPSEESLRAFTRSQLLEWVDGHNIPCVILAEGEIIGTAGARVNAYTEIADLGYWIDEGHEGRGAVSRAVSGLLDWLFLERHMQRAEIRTGVENLRSRALAERLGFTHEGTLRAAQPVGKTRQDVAVYGLLSVSWSSDDSTH